MPNKNWANSPTGPSAFQYRNGYNRWEAYGIPGRPYLTGGVLENGLEVKVEFPTITRNIIIQAGAGTDTDEIRIHFDTKDNVNVYAQHRYITLSDDEANPDGGRIDLPVRVKEIYISNATSNPSAFELVAFCAAVDKNDVASLSGSGINTNADGT